MKQVSRSSLAAAAIAATALALPATAPAHPSVYVTSAPVLSTIGSPLCSATGNVGAYTAAAYLATCVNQTRYVFTNHGNTALLRESNGKTTDGAISYAHRPGGATGLAAATDYDVFANPPQGPTTGAQVHATCDVPALTTDAVIRSWQGTDPFYAYVPFQRTTAGFDDDPSAWLGTVLSATGVDLAVVADSDAAREAACEALPGATPASYVPADATQSSKAAWALGPVQEAVEPLEERIATLTSDLGTATSALTAIGAELTGVKGALSNANAEIASLKAALTRLKLTFPATAPSLDALAASGLALKLAGPAGQTVNVRLLVPAAKLKKLGLRSRIVGTHKVVLAADGSASFVLRTTTAAASALRKHTGKLAVLGEATTGDRRSLASATLAG